MKKALALLALMVMVSGTAFASAGNVPMKGTYAYCNYQVEQTAKKAGFKSAWEGGDSTAWYNATIEGYNSCRCIHYGKAYEGRTCAK